MPAEFVTGLLSAAQLGNGEAATDATQLKTDVVFDVPLAGRVLSSL